MINMQEKIRYLIQSHSEIEWRLSQEIDRIRNDHLASCVPYVICVCRPSPWPLATCSYSNIPGRVIWPYGLRALGFGVWQSTRGRKS